jgi:hypothetical protein
MNCTVCGTSHAKEYTARTGEGDTLCYPCSCWFLCECQRRAGFGSTIVVVAAPEQPEEQIVIGRKKDMEPIN